MGIDAERAVQKITKRLEKEAQKSLQCILGLLVPSAMVLKVHLLFILFKLSLVGPTYNAEAEPHDVILLLGCDAQILFWAMSLMVAIVENTPLNFKSLQTCRGFIIGPNSLFDISLTIFSTIAAN